MAGTEEGGTDFDLLPSLLGYQLRLAQIAIFRDFEAHFGPLEITPGLFGVLVVIGANTGLTQNALARAVHLDRSTVVTVIDKLEARGLVQRRPADTDRRAHALALTAAGERLLARLKSMVHEHEARLAGGLTAAERRTLARLLQRILPDLR